MLTTVIIVQTLINFVLMFSLFLLLRERMLAARLARARENRLEALAASFCALGQAITGGEQVVTNAGRTGESAEIRPDSEATGSQETRRTSQPLGDAPETGEGWILSGKPNRDPRAPGGALSSGQPDRLRRAAELLDSGLSVEDVAARMAIPHGEVRVLWNLRRAQAHRGNGHGPRTLGIPANP